MACRGYHSYNNLSLFIIQWVLELVFKFISFEALTAFSSNLKVNLKTEPTPGYDTKLILPPNISTIFSEITRPRPIPLVFIASVSFTNPNSLKSLSWSCCLIPTPVSSTSIWRNFCSYVINIWALISILPVSVNFKAFDYRLSKTCWILFMSVDIWGEYVAAAPDLYIKP